MISPAETSARSDAVARSGSRKPSRDSLAESESLNARSSSNNITQKRRGSSRADNGAHSDAASGLFGNGDEEDALSAYSRPAETASTSTGES